MELTATTPPQPLPTRKGEKVTRPFVENQVVLLHSLGPGREGKEYYATIKGLTWDVGPVMGGRGYIVELLDDLREDYYFSHITLTAACIKPLRLTTPIPTDLVSLTHMGAWWIASVIGYPGIAAAASSPKGAIDNLREMAPRYIAELRD